MTEQVRVLRARNRTAAIRIGQGVAAWLFYGHLAIPLIASGLTASTLLAVGAGWSWRAVLLTAAGANFVYQLESLGWGHAEDNINQPARVVWRRRYYVFALGSLLVSGIVVSALLAVSSQQLASVAFALGGLGVVYALPVLPGGVRLKRYRFAKPIMIAAAWSAGTVYLPLLAVGALVKPGAMALLAFYRFAFLLPNALCSDVPDIVGDRSVGLRTVASTLGAPTTKRLSLLASVVAAVLLFVILFSGPGAGNIASITWMTIEVFGLIGGAMAVLSQERIRGAHYRWVLDGVLLLLLAHVVLLQLT